jgi:hypothetical protein
LPVIVLLELPVCRNVVAVALVDIVPGFPEGAVGVVATGGCCCTADGVIASGLVLADCMVGWYSGEWPCEKIKK